MVASWWHQNVHAYGRLGSFGSFVPISGMSLATPFGFYVNPALASLVIKTYGNHINL
jgi:hypothetical protein